MTAGNGSLRWRAEPAWPWLGAAGLFAGLFVGIMALFFTAFGRSPWLAFGAMWDGTLGSAFALSEVLVKATPILLCALATAIPARMGLISAGAEGQLSAGALVGSALVLAASVHGTGDGHGPLLLVVSLASGAAGGALWGAWAGWLRARLGVNETIGTLLLNYLPPLLIEHLVYGPWKDPQSLGWPATLPFPSAARLPTLFGSRVHGGLLLALLLVLAAHVLFTHTRWGFMLDVLRGPRDLARRAGLRATPAIVWIMACGGAAAGLAGMCETSVLEGRLQPGIGAGAGYSGFLVAWLARGRLLPLVPLALLVGALLASADNLQLTADLPSSIGFVLQGVLFAVALVASGQKRRRSS